MSRFVSLAGRRKAAGLSQSQLADAAGVTRQAIGAIEAGRVQPSVALALAISKALGASVEELFGEPSAGRLQADLAPTTVTRAAIAIVGGRVTAKSLDDNPGQPEAAGALVASWRDGRADLETLADTQRVASTLFLAGCEPALGLLAGHVNARAAYGVWFPASNRDALDDLLAARVHAATLHGSQQELERMFRRLRRREEVDLYEIATIEEGWIVASGNPLKLRGARDLGRSHVRLANRAQGSAARTLLESELRRVGISTEDLSGYRRALSSHADVARAVAFGYADIGIGVAAIADAFKLGFIPLRGERCVLAVRRSDRNHLGVSAMLAALRSNAFRRDLGAFGPYDLTRLGELLSL